MSVLDPIDSTDFRPSVRDSDRGTGEPPPPAHAAALVRDVILGGQDGLVNVLGLVLGMAAATADSRIVLTAGLAALLAESIAMAGVAFTATGAERQLGISIREQEEVERLGRMRLREGRRRARMEAAGVPASQLAAVEAEIAAESAAWSDELERARRSLAPVRETHPLRAAAVVGVSTATGSSVPLLPFVLLPMAVAPFAALVFGGAVLAVAGMERASLTGGSRLRAAAEMLGIGLVSALAGFLIGHVLRVPAA